MSNVKEVSFQEVSQCFADTELGNAFANLDSFGVDVVVSLETPILDTDTSRQVVVGMKEVGMFMKFHLSQVQLRLQSISECPYVFHLSEMRCVAKELETGYCIINLNNSVFLKTKEEYFEPLSLIVRNYHGRRGLLIPVGEQESWVEVLRKNLGSNGGLELIGQLEDLEKEKQVAIDRERYDDAGKLADLKVVLSKKLQDLIEKALPV